MLSRYANVPKIVTPRLNVPTLVFSKALAASATKRATRLLSVRRDLLISARTARAKVQEWDICWSDNQESADQLTRWLTGHKTKDCKANRKFDLDHVADKLPEEAWDMMRKASNEKDLDDFREVLSSFLRPQAQLTSTCRLSRSTPRLFHWRRLRRSRRRCVLIISRSSSLLW